MLTFKLRLVKIEIRYSFELVSHQHKIEMKISYFDSKLRVPKYIEGKILATSFGMVYSDDGVVKQYTVYSLLNSSSDQLFSLKLKRKTTYSLTSEK